MWMNVECEVNEWMCVMMWMNECEMMKMNECVMWMNVMWIMNVNDDNEWKWNECEWMWWMCVNDECVNEWMWM